MTWTAADRAKAARKRRSHKLSSGARAKLSKARTGKPHPHKGHKTTAATRKKLSAALKGKKRKITHPGSHKGRKLSTAARQAMSARMKGKKHPHKGHPGVHRSTVNASKPHSQRAKASSIRRTIHKHGQIKASRSKVSHRLAQRFNVLDKVHRRKFGSLTNTAILNQKLKTSIHGRKHSLTNKGVLNLSGHHFRRHR